MSELRRRLEEYLSLRRSLGYKLTCAGRLLANFVSDLEESGLGVITTARAVEWACGPSNIAPNTAARRLGVVRGFAEFVRSYDPRTEIPTRTCLPYCSRRPTPYFYSLEDIGALLDAIAQLRIRSNPAFRRATIRTVFGLLAVSGMRHGEALSLDRRDFNRREGSLTLRESKFGKSRRIPLHVSTRAALLAYERIRDRACPRPKSAAFFVSMNGTRLLRQNVSQTFDRLRVHAGLSKRKPRPRIHDLRHSFAIRTLLDWYRSGVDVQTRLPLLSTYLGHADPSSTYWYLTAVPELVSVAVKRLEAIGRLR